MRNDEIGDLSGPVEVERVIDEEDGRTFDKKGVEVLILDGQPDDVGDRFSPECQLEYENPVPLIRDYRYGEVIGTAVLYRQGKSLLADLFLRYDSEERLLLETGGKLYPAVGGVITGREPTGVSRITQARINAISLQVTRNADDRILPI